MKTKRTVKATKVMTKAYTKVEAFLGFAAERKPFNSKDAAEMVVPPWIGICLTDSEVIGRVGGEEGDEFFFWRVKSLCVFFECRERERGFGKEEKRNVDGEETFSFLRRHKRDSHRGVCSVK